jgi:hypothetical protein
VHWNGNVTVNFPVRFEDKASIPLVLGARRPTEGELLDYYLHGREHWTLGGDDHSNGDGHKKKLERPDVIDTSLILSYFIRRFEEAIPGIEAEILRTLHSMPALRAVLFGPTGVVQLAERIDEGLRGALASGALKKTPTSTGFQLVEIIAVLRRCERKASTREIAAQIKAATERCSHILELLSRKHRELREPAFEEYCRAFAGE